MFRTLALLGTLCVSNLSYGVSLTCNLQERLTGDKFDTQNFELNLDANSNADQFINSKYYTSHLVIQNGFGTFTIPSVLDQPTFNFTVVDNADITIQAILPGYHGNALIDISCGRRNPTAPAVPPPPKSVHCILHESLGAKGSEKVSDQPIDLPYTTGKHDMVYMPKAKLLSIYGVFQLWGGDIITVFEGIGNTKGCSAFGPWNHEIKLAWQPQPLGNASFTCDPVN